jgi:hypothetical protein
MMKHNLLVIIFFTLVGCAFGQKKDSSFFDKLLNDFSRNSSFVLVKIVLENKGINYLIENDDLFYFFNQAKGLNRTQYQKFMMSILKSNQSINISRKDISKFGFLKVIANADVRAKFSKGKDSFVKYYFKEKVLKDGFTEEVKNNIVQALFYWQIVTRIDGESGVLIIDYK